MLFHGSYFTGLCPCIVSGFTDNLTCRQYYFLLPSTSIYRSLFELPVIMFCVQCVISLHLLPTIQFQGINSV
jgi:hypothetical protein